MHKDVCILFTKSWLKKFVYFFKHAWKIQVRKTVHFGYLRSNTRIPTWPDDSRNCWASVSQQSASRRVVAFGDVEKEAAELSNTRGLSTRRWNVPFTWAYVLVLLLGRVHMCTVECASNRTWDFLRMRRQFRWPNWYFRNRIWFNCLKFIIENTRKIKLIIFYVL